MNRKVLSVISSVLMLYGLLLLVGCSGGGGGGSSTTTTTTTGTVTSLEVGEKVSVVDAQETAAKIRALKMGVTQLAVADLPTDAEYNTDVAHVYVEERSADALSIINEILCMFGQTGYDEMVNEGNYKAQINMDQCEGSKSDASSAGQSSQNQSSGSNAVNYEDWIVNSARADNDSAHIVKVWIHEEAEDEYDDDKTIKVKLTITESVSDENPYGIFTLYFQGVSPDGTEEMMTGYLKTERTLAGKVLMQFYDNGEHGSETFTESVTLDRGSDGSTGAGTIYNSNSYEGTKTFNIAYNDTYFLRSDGTDSTCLTRLNPSSSVWRYGVYNDENHASPGSRVAINSGFPIKYGEYHGHAGYWGIWFPDDVTLTSGDTVSKMDYSNEGSTSEDYTIFIVGGKLQKHTKKTLTLAEIAGIPIEWSSCTDSGGGNWTCTQSRVEWDSTEQAFYKNAEMNEQEWLWKDLDSPVEVTFGNDDWDFSFWSQALGGSGRVNLRDPSTGDLATLTNSSVVVFHVQDTVFPGDDGIPTSLACFENCPDPTTINTSSPYFEASTWESQSNFESVNRSTAPDSLVESTNYIGYTFDDSTMELKYDSVAAVMTSSDNQQYGVWTGAMFEPTQANFDKLACDWDQSESSTCQWQAWDKMDVFYTWETGAEQWNKLTALQSGGTFLSFDPPLSVEYEHTTGAKYYLEYSGFGDLHGIPGKCVDMDTGLDTDCWNGQDDDKFIRWVPEFSVADATAVTDAVSGSTYYIKALEKEERMNSVDLSECTGAGLSLTTYDLPDATLYVAPDIGDEPTVDDAAAVIGGVLQ